MPGRSFYKNERDLIEEVQAELKMGIEKNDGKPPRVLVIGALGRSGKGSLDLCRSVGIPDENLLKWDLPETKKGGPFVEIRESEVSIALQMQVCVGIADCGRYSSIVYIWIRRFQNS